MSTAMLGALAGNTNAQWMPLMSRPLIPALLCGNLAFDAFERRSVLVPEDCPRWGSFEETAAFVDTIHPPSMFIVISYYMYYK